MADWDEYELAGAHRLQELHAAKLQTLTNLEVHKSNGDVHLMGEEIERLAEIERRQHAIADLHQRHQQSKQPQQYYQPSKEELDAKPVDRMDWGDTWRMIAKDAKNPQELNEMAVRFQEGINEVNRRKARGV